jgi:tetratricopeptide (TPR) repeat protein
MSGLFDEAVAHHRAGRLEAAERGYLAVTNVEPERAEAWYLLSVLAMAKKDDARALETLRRALELAPDHPVYHSNLGLILRRLGQNEEALAALLRAVALKPDLVEASHNLGLVLLNRGELDAAITCFERVADLKPSLFANQRRLADALVVRGDLPRARGHYHCALVLQPDSEYCRAALERVIKTLAQDHVQASSAPV